MRVRTLTPVGGWTVIEPFPLSSTTASGLHLPETMQPHELMAGRVLAVGPGKRAEKTAKRLTPDVKPGDEVLYPAYRALELTLDGKKVQLIESDLLVALSEGAQPSRVDVSTVV